MCLFSCSGRFSCCLAEEGTARWGPHSGSRRTFWEGLERRELGPRRQAGTGSGHRGVGSHAEDVWGPPSTLPVPGKLWQCPGGPEACWPPISRYGNSLPREVIQLQVQMISRKALAKFRGDRHDGMTRGEWEVASPRASVGEDLLRPPARRWPMAWHTQPPPVPRGCGRGRKSEGSTRATLGLAEHTLPARLDARKHQRVRGCI